MMQKLLGLPIDASAHGAEIDRLILWVHVLMVVLFIGWIAFFLFTIARFRKARHPQADYTGVKTHTSSYLEAVIAVLEIVLLVGVSIPFWSWKVSAFPTESEAVRVRVIAQQFAWNIQYPGSDGVFGRTDIKLVNEQTNPIGLDRSDPHGKDDLTTINQLHLPVNKPVIVELTTKDVIHSFALPLMRVKQDTIPGMSIPVHFTPTLTSEQVRDQMTTTVNLPTKRKLDGWIAMQDYADKEGKVIVKKGRAVSEDTAKKLVDAGVTSIRIGPRTPMEIACAQLCGLGHYRMRGFLTIHDQKGYDAWLKEELEALEQ